MSDHRTSHAPPHRYVFVGGLHRSGTSMLARMLAGHPGIAGIEGAPVPENEGAYLQGAIAHTRRHGRPMHFATDPAQHHVECGPLDRREVRDRLADDWAPWFAPAPWRVEKSPVNLTRMRLYQQFFPLSQFVVVIRHPEAVAAATAKWVRATPHEMTAHWLEAHERMAQDLAWLHAALVLRYEDLVSRPDAWRAALARYLSLQDPLPGTEPLRNGNADYAEAPEMPPEQAVRAARWGYGPGMRVDPWTPHVSHHTVGVVQSVQTAIGGHGA